MSRYCFRSCIIGNLVKLNNSKWKGEPRALCKLHPGTNLNPTGQCGTPSCQRRVNYPHNKVCIRQFCTTVSHKVNKTVLGIETSCDDTGAAVVDSDGTILGEALHSQTRLHVQFGGILPPIARNLHRDHIENIVTTAVKTSAVDLEHVDAIAVTVKPGLAMSLAVGLEYARKLAKDYGKPFIPIHHMEAHALTARMIEQVDFPFLVLLVSGGHCLLTVARGVEDFLLLGKSTDIAPGDALDKVARRLKLQHLPQYASVSGGRAIELEAQSGDPRAFEFQTKVHRYHNCNFSFSGIRTGLENLIEKEEKKHDIQGGNMLPNMPDICASLQYHMLRHLANRLQRAIMYCDLKGLLPKENRSLVVSGGVASNMYLRQGLQKICSQYSLQLVCPPTHLCTDNGIMIAWNGMEKLKLNVGFADPERIIIQPKCPLGKDISSDVEAADITIKRIKLHH